MNKKWVEGSGNIIFLNDMLREIDEYVSNGGKIFVGTDSQIKSDTCVFVTAICLHKNNCEEKYARYYFHRKKLNLSSFKDLRHRIMKEVQESLDISLYLVERYSNVEIEVHVDVGRTQKSQTRKFVDTISGWLKGVGFECKMKPHSWASSSVADVHTK